LFHKIPSAAPELSIVVPLEGANEPVVCPPSPWRETNVFRRLISDLGRNVCETVRRNSFLAFRMPKFNKITNGRVNLISDEYFHSI
jgi:hypothetical protein